MSENKGSTISVRLNAEEVVGVFAVGKVIVRNPSLNGVANVWLVVNPVRYLCRFL